MLNLGDLPGARWAVFCNTNIEIIEGKLKKVIDQFKPSDSFQKALEKVKEKNEGLGEEDLELIMKDSHPKLHEARQKQLDELNEMLDDEVEWNLQTIKVDHLPDEITANQLRGLNFLISV